MRHSRLALAVLLITAAGCGQPLKPVAVVPPETVPVSAAAEAKPEHVDPAPKFPWHHNFALAAHGAVASGCRRAELLIDGNATNYDGGDGYAESDWSAKPPQPMLVTLPQAHHVNTVRFLLWDQDPNRFYRYKVEISADASGEGKAWTLAADHSTTGEYKGWQTTSFAEQPVRRVRVTGTFNSVNTGFHIVEIQLFNIPEGFNPHWDDRKEPEKPNAAPATGAVTNEF